MLEQAIIEHIQGTVSDIQAAYTECNDFIAIGGIALYCHMQGRGLKPLIRTKDADVVCGTTSYSYIRNEFEVVFNARMSKHEYKIALTVDQNEQNIDVDVYLVFNHSLRIDDSEILEHAVDINGIKCAHLVHLLVLKIDNYTLFGGNKESDKFKKIIRDILQILGLIDSDELTLKLLAKNFDEARFLKLKEITEDHAEFYIDVCRLFEVKCFTENLCCIEKQCA
ncbi:hypothetical protein BCU30_019090 [Vibrio lentus]|uniref:hypothetical protein n=1 Tax=Vibrio TaxID=662 RepID=UPI000C854C16|nr:MULTISPECIES: hypothetical protein [Vibrio]CAK2019791.1 Nucleotidyltransferase [Vibrio crassostreae]MCW4438937.1 hypothetical protein [Vibrio splendidus]PMJ06985.1 hypothetical protein BCU30_11135 [Vibrio lentus]CAK2142546.1 Nucleotidyltransferase [Vibrio crassostreae]CAK2348701.1 Nucleotidyltransferase [Vibrio crassostreae]